MKTLQILILTILIAIFNFSLAQSSMTQGSGTALNPNSLNATYQESFEGDPSSMLQSSIFLGQDGIWNASLANGTYLLENQQDANAIFYIYLGEVEGNAASLDVTANYQNYSAAGLLYKFDTSTRHYFAFTLTGPNSYAFYKRDNSGFTAVLQGSSGAIVQGTNRLSIVDNAGEMNLYINNQFVASVMDNEITGDRVGVLVAGTGSYQLDNLNVYQQAQVAAPINTPSTAEDLTVELDVNSDESSSNESKGKIETQLSVENQATTEWSTHAPTEALTLEYEVTYIENNETSVFTKTVTIKPQSTGLYEVIEVTAGSTNAPITYTVNAEGYLFEEGVITDQNLYHVFTSLWNFGEAFFDKTIYSLESNNQGWLYSYQGEDIQLKALFDKTTGILLEESYCDTELCSKATLISISPLVQEVQSMKGFVGSYSSEDLSLSLTMTEDRIYKGSLIYAGVQFEVSAIDLGSSFLKGFILTEDEPLEFQAQLSGTSLVFSQADSEWILERSEVTAGVGF